MINDNYYHHYDDWISMILRNDDEILNDEHKWRSSCWIQRSWSGISWLLLWYDYNDYHNHSIAIIWILMNNHLIEMQACLSWGLWNDYCADYFHLCNCDSICIWCHREQKDYQKTMWWWWWTSPEQSQKQWSRSFLNLLIMILKWSFHYDNDHDTFEEQFRSII